MKDLQNANKELQSKMKDLLTHVSELLLYTRSFHIFISILLRPKTDQMAQVRSQSGPELRLTSHRSTHHSMMSSLTSSFSDHSVWHLDLPFYFLADLWSQSKLGLSESLSERLIQKMKWNIVHFRTVFHFIFWKPRKLHSPKFKWINMRIICWNIVTLGAIATGVSPKFPKNWTTKIPFLIT